MSALPSMPMPSLSPPSPPKPFSSSASTYLIAGGIAGLSVDLVLYPIDTIKTRMQSSAGLWKSGGFRQLYSGLTSVAVGSAPSSSLFFLIYEYSKKRLSQTALNVSGDGAAAAVSPTTSALIHCFSAGIGECIACIIRVPTENIKQKMQARPDMFKSAVSTARYIYERGGARGFYVGYLSTMIREIPFAFIQFPIYEYIKTKYSIRQSRPATPTECAVIGSFAGAVAAAATTPMDTIKTRMMTATTATGPDGTHLTPTITSTVRTVYREGGIPRLFSGVVPRVIWIGLGGGVFFGAYEAAKAAISGITHIPIAKKLGEFK